MTRPGDEPKHAWFAGHGYASVRVDMQGAGDSFGVMRDEYAAQELKDGKEVIAWLAKQPWCTGKVGMFGISWGGFNSLQVAALQTSGAQSHHHLVLDRRPLCLGTCTMRAAVFSTITLDWGTTFFSILALPGDPQIMGPGLAQELAGTARRHPLSDRALAEPPATRRLLEARFGQRELSRYRMRGLCRWRLARRLHQRHPQAL